MNIMSWEIEAHKWLYHIKARYSYLSLGIKLGISEGVQVTLDPKRKLTLPMLWET